MIETMNRLLAPVRRRLENMVARAVVSLVSDAPKLQTAQLALLEDEAREHCERFQQYGVTSVPLPGAEAIVLFVGGLRDHPLITNVDDRRYRKKDLQPGECALYTHQGLYLLLKVGQTLEANGPLNLVNGGVYRIAGTQVVGAQGAAVADPIGGSVVDVQARAALASLLARVRAHGLIAS